MEEAIRSGHLERVRELIRSRADVNARQGYGSKEASLLHLAIQKGYEDIVLALLEAGADVHAKDNIGRTPLHWACWGSKKVVQALIDRGSRVNERDKFGRTPLMLADHDHYLSADKRYEISRCLLRAGANYEGLEQSRVNDLLYYAWQKRDLSAIKTLLKNGYVKILSREEEEELLHFACGEGDIFVTRTLLENGCRLSILSIEEKEELLHLACRQGDAFVARILLKNGCSVSILSIEEEEELLHLARRQGDAFVARILLKNGCSVSILSREEQEELLHRACRQGDAFVARTLLENGCRLSILSIEEKEELLHHACREGDVFVVRTLLENGCRLTILSIEEKEELLHHACRQGDVFVVRTLLENGCRLSILSREEKEELLHHACRQGDVFVVRTLLETGCRLSILSREEKEELLHHACCKNGVFVVHTLLKNGCSVSILSREEQEELLHHAYCEGEVVVVHALLKDGCTIGTQFRTENGKVLCLACGDDDVLFIEALLASGCNVNCVDSTGFTPLMAATEKDHEQIVKKLILAGANLGTQNADGNTALHLAALCNNIQSGILLAEGGASLRTKNKLSQTPLDLASVEFKVAIKESLSFTTRKALCIIGNAESGKSTLIAALQAESNSFLGKIVNQFRRVSDRRQRTAGIETVPHCSQKYGEVLFFDFAGQDDYHGPHQMFLESLLSKPGVSMTLLLVVKMTEQEDAILHQLHRWLTPVALMATPASPPHIIIIGSFLDKVKSHQEEATAKLTRCMETTKRDLDGLPLEFVGSSFLNCRQPQSKGIDQICKFLQEIPVSEFRATHTRYSLAWVLSQIRSSLTAQAVQLKEFSKWVQDNKDNLPQTMPPPEEVCQDLSAAGHALYLPNKEDPPRSWLVLDLSDILHYVYGNLFSKSEGTVNEFGLIQCCHLAELLPGQDLEMVQQLLISLEFCLPVDPSVLKVDLSDLTQSKETSGWLFFPALISAKPPQTKGLPQQSVRYLCWQLRTAKKHSISARLLQTILLRLAANFVVKQCNEEGIQHCCSIWWNGISWKSTVGVGVTVQIVNNRVIHVIAASLASADKSCQYLTDVISDIISAVHRLSPQLAAGTYIVHPPKMSDSEDITAPPPKELYPVEGIRRSIRGNEEFALSLKDTKDDCNMVAITDLFGGCIPSLKDVERISWPQPDPCRPELDQLQPDVLLQTVYTCEGYPILFRTYVSRPSAGKGRAVLEGVGLAPETIRACYGRHPLEEEEAVQDGLINWAEGHHGYSRTWRVLLTAMEYAGVAQHHCQGLRDELYQKLTDVPATPSQPRPAAEQSKADLQRGAASGSPIPSGEQEVHVSPNQPRSPPGPNQPPTGPNQPPTGPNQPPTGPNQPPAGPNRSPTGPDQPPAGPNQSPTGPNQPPTGPNQPPTGPNQPPTGPNKPPTGPDQPELHSEVNSVLTPTDSNTTPSSARALLDVSSTPDMQDVDELVVTSVAANWQRVALRLGVEGCVSEVVLKSHPNDCEGACRDMLDRWLRGDPHTGEEERTWSTLLTALGRAGFEELEKRLRREHFHN